ncbi:MAG: hypothetical protein IPG80_14410 [Anaerolineales bacterium]|uniref:SH3 domain-containing protein n=1 Tax=Candidatus Villigracilis vicinus TaxID=3140679 RepID=UPI0031357272|nr:hypothetical protein [Anaerolineales bacterium]MBK9778437.1 hypothetical protein [Anaerolineales bacterium]
MNAIRKSFSVIFSILCVGVLVACIPQKYAPPPPPPEVALTLTVQAIQLDFFTQTAQALQSQPIIIVVTATPDPNILAPTTDPAATTSSAVTITVSQNTNCRSGPSQAFDEVGALGPGQVAEVIGKDTIDNYWVIKLPDASGKTCWLWGQYATVTGDASKVADAATPTAVSNGAPIAPTLLNAELKCTNLSGGNYQYKVILKWADNSSNENKFVINSSTGKAFSTPPNKTSFSFEENLPSGTTLSATLAAANEKGASQPVGTGAFKCP